MLKSCCVSLCELSLITVWLLFCSSGRLVSGQTGINSSFLFHGKTEYSSFGAVLSDAAISSCLCEWLDRLMAEPASTHLFVVVCRAAVRVSCSYRVMLDDDTA